MNLAGQNSLLTRQFYTSDSESEHESTTPSPTQMDMGIDPFFLHITKT
jgi:hypothetical protein